MPGVFGLKGVRAQADRRVGGEMCGGRNGSSLLFITKTWQAACNASFSIILHHDNQLHRIG